MIGSAISLFFSNLYTFRTAIIFGTIKNDSLLINNLASNNCLCHRNVFQNGVNNFSKKKNVKSASNFVYFKQKDFVQMLPCGPNTYHTMYGESLDFQASSEMITQNVLS